MPETRTLVSTTIRMGVSMLLPHLANRLPDRAGSQAIQTSGLCLQPELSQRPLGTQPPEQNQRHFHVSARQLRQEPERFAVRSDDHRLFLLQFFPYGSGLKPQLTRCYKFHITSPGRSTRCLQYVYMMVYKVSTGQKSAPVTGVRATDAKR